MPCAGVAPGHQRCIAVQLPAPRIFRPSALPCIIVATSLSEGQGTGRRPLPSRRNILLQISLAACIASPSYAGDFIVPLDSSEQLPKGYQELTRRLVTALQDSISADINGASENEIRRKADPAKGLVKDWVSKWRDDRIVRGSVSHDQISAMLSQLGSFYQKNGARARMSKDVGSSLLDKLKVAEASLPAIETKKKGIFG